MSKLNANAKPFSFNPKASSFIPAQFTAAAASAVKNTTPATPASTAAPAPVATASTAVVTTSGSSSADASSTSNSTSHPPTIPAKPKEPESWEELDGSSSSPPANAATSAPSKGEQSTIPKPSPQQETPSQATSTPTTVSVIHPAAASAAPVSSPSPAPAASPSPIPPTTAPSSLSSSSASSKKDELEVERELSEEERRELAEMDAAEEAEEEEKEKGVPLAGLSSSSSSSSTGGKDKKGQPLKAYHDEREHVNIVFIGHVDAGKSTISGQILFLTGQVDKRTIEKYEREAKEKNRESWYLAYVLDTSEEERDRGKTVEVGRAHFTTAKKRYTLLDAPGHKSFVPNMIGGAAQADVGVLVISSSEGEFEAGLKGQTVEHVMLAKTLGLTRLVVLINKMDHETVKWDVVRYTKIVDQLTPILQKWSYSTKNKTAFFTPCSGMSGMNIRDQIEKDKVSWIDPKVHRPLFQILDDLPPIERDPNAPLRMPVIARYKDMGAVFIIGKLESGSLITNRKVFMTPNNKEMLCTGVSIDEVDVEYAKPGENVVCKLKGVEEEEIQTGFVLSYPDNPCKRARKFDASAVVLELLEHRPILTAGYSAVLHLHAVTAECKISALLGEPIIDKDTKQKTLKKIRFAKTGVQIELRVVLAQSVAIEAFTDFPQLGRFTLRDEGKTILIGKVTKIYPE